MARMRLCLPHPVTSDRVGICRVFLSDATCHVLGSTKSPNSKSVNPSEVYCVSGSVIANKFSYETNGPTPKSNAKRVEANPANVHTLEFAFCYRPRVDSKTDRKSRPKKNLGLKLAVGSAWYFNKCHARRQANVSKSLPVSAIHPS